MDLLLQLPMVFIKSAFIKSVVHNTAWLNIHVKYEVCMYVHVQSVSKAMENKFRL